MFLSTFDLNLSTTTYLQVFEQPCKHLHQKDIQLIVMGGLLHEVLCIMIKSYTKHRPIRRTLLLNNLNERATLGAENTAIE